MSFINKLTEKHGSKKVFFIMAGVFLLCAVIISITVNESQKKFSVDGVEFKYKDEDNGIWTFVDEQEEILRAYNQVHQRSLEAYNNQVFIEYKGNVIEQRLDLKNLAYEVYLNEQLIYQTQNQDIQYNSDLPGDGQQEKNEMYEAELMKEVIQVSQNIESGALPAMIFFNITFVLLGTSQLIFPEVYWKLRHFLSVSGGEPTDFFIITTQIGGMVFIAACLLVPLITVLYQ